MLLKKAFLVLLFMGGYSPCLSAAVYALQFQDHTLWTAYDESLFERMVDGVFSCVALLGVGPLIRYEKDSKVCQRFADTLQHRLEKAQAQGPGGLISVAAFFVLIHVTRLYAFVNILSCVHSMSGRGCVHLSCSRGFISIWLLWQICYLACSAGGRLGPPRAAPF